MNSSNLRRIKVSNVYDRSVRSKSEYVINIGGARSTKSWSVAQIFVQRLTTRKCRKLLVTRKTLPSLRRTAYQLVISLLSSYGFYNKLLHNRTELVVYCPWTGSSITFLSIDNPEKIQSTEWNDIWMEEAMEFDWNDFVVLDTRMSGPTSQSEPNQMFLTCNPTDENGWINQRMVLGDAFKDRIEVIKSTWRDNPFLDQAYIQKLVRLKEFDPEKYRVYAEGEYGELTNLIYQPYTLLREFPESFDETIYGLDFGFNNPSALLEINLRDGTNCYLRQLLYQTHLTNTDLIEVVKTLIKPEHRTRPIYADAAEPARIDEFFRAGFNIHPADKDVKQGIDFCKRFKFFSLYENSELNKERAGYKWKVDKNGNFLEEPVKFMDHLMDTKRYGLYTHGKSLMHMPGLVFSGEDPEADGGSH